MKTELLLDLLQQAFPGTSFTKCKTKSPWFSDPSGAIHKVSVAKMAQSVTVTLRGSDEAVAHLHVFIGDEVATFSLVRKVPQFGDEFLATVKGNTLHLPTVNGGTTAIVGHRRPVRETPKGPSEENIEQARKIFQKELDSPQLAVANLSGHRWQAVSTEDRTIVFKGRFPGTHKEILAHVRQRIAAHTGMKFRVTVFKDDPNAKKPVADAWTVRAGKTRKSGVKPNQESDQQTVGGQQENEFCGNCGWSGSRSECAEDIYNEGDGHYYCPNCELSL